MTVRLTSVYEWPDRHQLLLRLLKERNHSVNISHKSVPAWDDHVAFVDSKPYRDWSFIDNEPKGAVYLSKQNEIGIFLFKDYQGQGIGPQAIRALMERHGPKRYLANINPANEKSIAMFGRLGFSLCQHTYELIA